MTKDSATITVRLPIEVCEWIKADIRLYRVLKWLYGAVKGDRAHIGEDGEIVLDNGYERMMEGMPYNCLKELSEMCDMTGGSLGIMMYDLYTRLKEGELDMDEGIVLFE